MALTVNTNVASLSAQRSLGGSQNMLNTSLERLSTGLRINSAKDDAAGLAIGERFSSQSTGLKPGCTEYERCNLAGSDSRRGVERSFKQLATHS